MFHSKGQTFRSKSKLLVAATLLALGTIVSPAYSEDYTITNFGTLGGNLSASAGINVQDNRVSERRVRRIQLALDHHPLC
jgi:hypothetical protein